jgi:hypothetical protein
MDRIPCLSSKRFSVKCLEILETVLFDIFGIVLAPFYFTAFFLAYRLSHLGHLGGDIMAEQFTMLAEIANWPFYWPVIALVLLLGIALFVYEIIDRFLAQKRGELSNRLQWDDGYIDRISKAFKSKETASDQKTQTKDGTEATFVEHAKTERMEML